jgi:hypothetical protein
MHGLKGKETGPARGASHEDQPHEVSDKYQISCCQQRAMSLLPLLGGTISITGLVEIGNAEWGKR